jgi:hypothetical protein
MSSNIFAPPKHHVPMDRNDQFEIIGELRSAYVKIERLSKALADLTDLLQEQMDELSTMKKELSHHVRANRIKQKESSLPIQRRQS